MATFNGLPFIENQISSLIAQSKLPDELIVYDDASLDGTPEVIKAMSDATPFPITLITGEKNKGVNGAFEAALSISSGDVVFFCDQDDLWHPEKIKKFMEIFDTDLEVGLIFCDAVQIDERNVALQKSLWDTAKFSTSRRNSFSRSPFESMLKGSNFIYGMASAFRRDCLSTFLPIEASSCGMTHDTWFSLHTLATGWRGIALNEKLVSYRRHENQTTKIESKVSVFRQQRLIDRQQRMAATIEALQNVRANVEKSTFVGYQGSHSRYIQAIGRKIDHLVLRESLRAKPTSSLTLKAVFSSGYWLYARGPVSVLRDIAKI